MCCFRASRPAAGSSRRDRRSWPEGSLPRRRNPTRDPRRSRMPARPTRQTRPAGAHCALLRAACENTRGWRPCRASASARGRSPASFGGSAPTRSRVRAGFPTARDPRGRPSGSASPACRSGQGPSPGPGSPRPARRTPSRACSTWRGPAASCPAQRPVRPDRRLSTGWCLDRLACCELRQLQSWL